MTYDAEDSRQAIQDADQYTWYTGQSWVYNASHGQLTRDLLIAKSLRLLTVCISDLQKLWGHLRQTYCQHSLHRQTSLLVGSHAAPPPFGTVFHHLYALLIVSLVLGLSSRLTCSQDICIRSTVRASDTLRYLLTDMEKDFTAIARKFSASHSRRVLDSESQQLADGRTKSRI